TARSERTAALAEAGRSNGERTVSDARSNAKARNAGCDAQRQQARDTGLTSGSDDRKACNTAEAAVGGKADAIGAIIHAKARGALASSAAPGRKAAIATARRGEAADCGALSASGCSAAGRGRAAPGTTAADGRSAKTA